MSRNRIATALVHTVGLAAITAGVEANSPDTEAATRSDPEPPSVAADAGSPDCGRVRWRDLALRPRALRDDTLDRPWQPCFADILQALADDIGEDGVQVRQAESASVGKAGIAASMATVFAVDVDIPDAGLREAVAGQLGKKPDEAITADEMATLTTLDAVDRRISDLTGLRHATGLRKLRLDRNAITNISELGELRGLAELSLGGNAVADIFPLAGLERLRSLSLARNRLRDADALVALADMHRLETLDLSGNDLFWLGPLHHLTRLRDLNLDDNRILDLPAFYGLQELRTLTLDGNDIEHVGALSALGGLRELSLADNRIANVFHLSLLAKLERLSLHGNAISDASALSGLTGLEQLSLGENRLTDVSPLAGLTDLGVLDLSGNMIVDVAPLAGLIGLVGLGLSNNGIVDASPLAGLTELTALDLGGNDLAEVPPLAGMGNLNTLWLNLNRISGITGLAGANGLTWLNLTGNHIEDIGPLSGLTGLATLDVAFNRIEDIAPLAGLDKLQRLWISGNRLSDLSPLSTLTGLTDLSVAWNSVEDIGALAGLESLRELALNDNAFADVSSLAGLTNLRGLQLGNNGIADLAPLDGLAELRRLYLRENDIRDVSPLSGLTRLRTLHLGGNDVADIRPLSGLRDLRVLDLRDNDISEIGEVGLLENLGLLELLNNEIVDIAPLIDNPGWGFGDWINLQGNPLGVRALRDADVLRRRGVWVLVDEPDLVAESLSASDEELAPGSRFTLKASVRNAGTGTAAATTLRYYHSADSTISSEDAQVGTNAVVGLAAAEESAESISLTAPSAAGTHYYGACADAVPGESRTDNNCSDAVRVEVSGTGGGGDDHGDAFDAATAVAVPSTTAGELEEGGDTDFFRFSLASDATLTVETAGSTDTFGTLFDGDETSLATDDDGGPGRNFRIERDVDAGTHYVEVRGYDSTTNGTYHFSVRRAGGGRAPDLVVESVSVDDATPDAGASITLTATVRNRGDAESASTTLRYYRSTDSTISSTDTEVGTDAVSGLAAGVAGAESISQPSPSAAGTYYLGACVDAVAGEADTANNCSGGVRIEVSGADDGNALLDGVLEIDAPGLPGNLCVYGPSAFPVAVGASGEGRAAVVAAGRWAAGRVVALGHDGYFRRHVLETADTGRLVTNALLWASGDHSPRIGVVGSEQIRGWLEEASHDVVEVELTPESLGTVDVVVLRLWAQSRTEIAALREFVIGGGGLVAASTGWAAQAYVNPEMDHARVFAGNQLLKDVGIGWGVEYLARTSDIGFAVEGLPGDLIHAGRALNAVVEHETGESRLTRSETEQAVKTVTVAIRCSHPDDEVFIPAVRTFADNNDRWPTQDEPVGETDALERIAATSVVKSHGETPAESVREHPAAADFPGLVPDDAPRIASSLTIDTSVPRWHSTGLYAAPGEVVTVTMPDEAASLGGFHIRIGAHSDGIWGRSEWRRMPEISRRFAVTARSTPVASAFGGLIYVEVPTSAGLGNISVDIDGAVAAPRFVIGQTDPEVWRDEIRHAPVPWAEIAGKNMIVTTDARDVRDLADPMAVAEAWDRVIELTTELAAWATARSSPERFVVDRQIATGYMHDGYPIMAHLDQSANLVNAGHLRSEGNWGFFHEVGHNHQNFDWTFDGTDEVTVNLFPLYVYEFLCGIPVAEHPRGSAEFQAEQMARYDFDAPDFEQWKRDPNLALVMYVQLQQAFGWDTYRRVFAAYLALSDAERPKSDDEKRDQWLVRFSREAGRNLGPFFEAWGIPTSQTARDSIAALPDWMPPNFPPDEE